MIHLLPIVKFFHNPLMQLITDSIRKEPGFDELYFRRAVLLNKNNLPGTCPCRLPDSMVPGIP